MLVEPTLIQHAFATGSAFVLVAWGLLVLTPRWRIARVFSQGVVPALLAAAYTGLVLSAWHGTEGGFDSLADLRALFESDALLLAGWFHYLAFDLLIGGWIVRNARRNFIPHAMVVPILLLTLMFGPAGYLLFLLVRTAWCQGRLVRPFNWPARWPAVEARLGCAGLFLMLLLVPTAFAWLFDDRVIHAASVWAKPMRFELGLGIYLLTLAFFMPMAGKQFAESRAARFVVWGAILPSFFELGYILFQAMRGEPSHFNESDTFHFVMFQLMGVGALTLTAASPVLAWGLWRNKASGLAPAIRVGLVLGLSLTFLLGASVGIVMAGGPTSVVGGLPGPDDLPLLGWSRQYGDYRVAHFLGVHSMHVIPVFAWAVSRWMGPEKRWPVTAFAAGYSALTLYALFEALAGRPVIW